jgi:Gamma-glutamyl cyclotransferase, AIG2-like
MQDPFFFGYGSLVNRRTHDYAEAGAARVTGWRRAWRKSPLRQRCFLTVVPAPGAEIEGLVAAVPGADWTALDDREHAYARHDVSTTVHHRVGRAVEVAIYAIPEGAHHDPGPEHPVLLSYVDVVVQGFLSEFGEAGVRRFFDSTDGWHVPVLDDRAQPIYARAQVLDGHERALVDDELARIGARVIPD